jgi:hypothetical protein
MDTGSGRRYWFAPLPSGGDQNIPENNPSGAAAREGGEIAIDVETGEAPPWRTTQGSLDALFDRLEGLDCSADYSYRELISYLSNPAAAQVDGAQAEGDYAAIMACRSDPRGTPPHRQAVRQIRRAAGASAVYLADGRAFVREALPGDFPELAIFNIELADAFAETGLPGFHVETTRFANLRAFSQMRREIRRTGLRVQHRDPTRLLALLLGLPVPAN